MDSINLVAIQDPEVIGTLIANSLVDVEEAQEAQTAFESFVTELEKEWSPERIRDHVLSQMRDKYVRAKKYLAKLELDNRDARVQGLSYKDRQTFTVKIKGGDLALKEITSRGEQYKKENFSVREIVSPLDMPVIQKQGFEKYLDSTYVF